MSNATATARTAPVRLPQQRATQPRLRVVTGEEVRRSSTGFSILCAMLLGAGLLALLLLNTARAEQSFALGALQQSSTTLTDNEEQLRSDISSVSAPQQVALKAQEMGMVPAGQVAYVRASDRKVLGVASPAAAGTPFTVGTLPDTPASGVADRAVAAATSGVLVYTPPKPKPSDSAAPSSTSAPSASDNDDKAAPSKDDARSDQSKPRTEPKAKPSSAAPSATPRD